MPFALGLSLCDELAFHISQDPEVLGRRTAGHRRWSAINRRQLVTHQRRVAGDRRQVPIGWASVQAYRISCSSLRCVGRPLFSRQQMAPFPKILLLPLHPPPPSHGDVLRQAWRAVAASPRASPPFLPHSGRPRPGDAHVHPQARRFLWTFALLRRGGGGKRGTPFCVSARLLC